MRLTVLGGCGGWPAAGQACSGYLVEHDGFRLLIDAGYATVPRLLQLVRPGLVDAVLISHGHPDHCADLNPLLRARAMHARSEPEHRIAARRHDHVDAARAWLHLREAALRDDVVLEAISGYRSHDYQLGIFERKLGRGLSVEEILTVNAAPGYSEHHSGLALDIGAPDEPPAEESFEKTRAFAWLRDNAGGHGFVMTYPRENPHGIVYEPWHWRCIL